MKGNNCRIAQYATGSVVIPHASDIEPLQIFEDPNFGGASMELGLYDVHTQFGTRGGNLSENISSLILKRGYMATVATEKNGTGSSKVYVAQDFDVLVRQLPENLDNAISFIRILPWRWTGKKGWAGGGSGASDAMNVKWQYDWDNVATSTLNTEYVPMRHNAGWNAYANINSKKTSTHALAFNEPTVPVKPI